MKMGNLIDHQTINEYGNNGALTQDQSNESYINQYGNPAKFQINSKIQIYVNGTLEEVISQYLNNNNNNINNLLSSPGGKQATKEEIHHEQHENTSKTNSIKVVNISAVDKNNPKDADTKKNNYDISFNDTNAILTPLSTQDQESQNTDNLNIDDTRVIFKRLAPRESTTKLQINTISSSGYRDIRQIYQFKKDKLGDGHFGEVRKASRINEVPLKYYAIKSISKKNLTSQDLFDLVKEVEIISGGDHPNIIKFYETYHDKHYFHIVMELCTGKELFDKIIEEGRIREDLAVKIGMKVGHAISYCHSRGVTHRDGKPENILFESRDLNSEIKGIDFGGSKKYGNDEKMHTILGTPYYVAPEVLQGEYNEKCDIWSIGALSYMMLCGEPPFKGKNNNEIFQHVGKDEVNYKNQKWNNISKDAKEFVRGCMNKNPALRPSAVQALELNWFKKVIIDRHSATHGNYGMLNNLKNFKCKQKLKKMVLRYLIFLMNEEQLRSYTSVFSAIDSKHKGTIHANEGLASFRLCGLDATADEVTKIIKYADEGNKASLDCTEFIMGCIDQKKGFTSEKLKTAFQYFDVNNSGNIEIIDIKDAGLRLGKKVGEENDGQKIITEVTNSSQKSISFEEFVTIFNPN